MIKRYFYIIAAIIMAMGLFGLVMRVSAGPLTDVQIENSVNPVVVGKFPATNQGNVPITSSIVVTFDQPIDPGTVHTGTFPFYTMQSGLLTEVYTVVNGVVQLTPSGPFWPGELVNVTVTTGHVEFPW